MNPIFSCRYGRNINANGSKCLGDHSIPDVSGGKFESSLRLATLTGGSGKGKSMGV